MDRWLENKNWDDILAWMDENESQHNSDCAVFIRWAQEIGLDKYGEGYGNYLATGTFLNPELYTNRRSRAATPPCSHAPGSTPAARGFDFDQARVTEDITSFYRGTGSRHPWDGVTDPIDPADGASQASTPGPRLPRYEVPDLGFVPLEVGPLARQMIAARPDAADFQDSDQLIKNVVDQLGPNVLTRYWHGCTRRQSTSRT